MKKIIILLGVPGSGKGTQAEKMANEFNYTHISSGELFRELQKDPNADENLKKELSDLMEKGSLVPDELVFRIVFDSIKKKMREKEGVILDGVVRSVSQAEGFEKFAEENDLQNEILALEIRLNDDIAVDRLLKRNEGREDDKPEIIKKRFEEQGNALLKPISEFYEKNNNLKVVNGNQTMEEVFSDIKKVLI